MGGVFFPCGCHFPGWGLSESASSQLPSPWGQRGGGQGSLMCILSGRLLGAHLPRLIVICAGCPASTPRHPLPHWAQASGWPSLPSLDRSHCGSAQRPGGGARGSLPPPSRQQGNRELKSQLCLGDVGSPTLGGGERRQREPLPVRCWREDSGVLGVSRCPWCSGSSVGFSKGNIWNRAPWGWGGFGRCIKLAHSK